jgi:anthranilate phosphoribosyltransferase
MPICTATDVNFTICTSFDGNDEVSLTSPTKTITSTMEGMLLPEDFGVSLFKASEIEGETTIEDLADMLSSLFLEKELKLRTM